MRHHALRVASGAGGVGERDGFPFVRRHPPRRLCIAPGEERLVVGTAERLALRDLNGDGDVLLVQRAQVVCQQPAETRQHDRAEHDAGDIDAPVELFVFAAAVVLRALFPLTADLVRVPVGGFKLFGHE